MENSVVEALNAIGAAVGIPAALLIGWLFLKVKGNSEEINDLRKELDKVRSESAAENSRIYDKLSQLASDVSFIRGRIEHEGT